jgi:hypothetical protein
MVPATLVPDGRGHRTEVTMGDKSPKSKQRNQKQKSAARADDAASARAKQASQSHVPSPAAKDRK